MIKLEKFPILLMMIAVLNCRLLFVAAQTSDITTSTTTTTTTIKTTTPPIACYNAYCFCFGPTAGISPSYDLVCQDFDSFDQLDFTENEPSVGKTIQAKITLIPKTMLALNDLLNLTGLTTSSTSQLKLSNLESIELSSQAISTLKIGGNTFTIEIVDSAFHLRYQGKPVECDDDDRLPIEASLSRLFANVTNLYLTGVDIAEPLCPYAFRNLRMQTLRITSLRPGSRIEFVRTHKDDANLPYNLNCNFTANLEIYNSIIDTDIDPIAGQVLHYDVFQRIRRIRLENTKLAGRIRTDTFHYFNVTEFTLAPSNWPEFLRLNGDMSWMTSLNSNVTVDLTNSSAIASTRSFPFNMGTTNDSYTYPDADFCYFRRFPHFRNILPIVNFNWNSQCSCTLIYVLQFAKKHKSDSTFESSSGRKVCIGNDFEQVIEACDFEAREERCEHDDQSTITLDYLTGQTISSTIQTVSSTSQTVSSLAATTSSSSSSYYSSNTFGSSSSSLLSTSTILSVTSPENVAIKFRFNLAAFLMSILLSLLSNFYFQSMLFSIF